MTMKQLSIIFLLASCQVSIDQHKHSGKDFKSKAAKEIKLEDGKGRATDIVTYPGGDRVDWKFVQLPEGQHAVKVRLVTKPARKNLDAAFNVYDEYFEKVGQKKATRKERSKKTKTLTLRGASGKLYFQIYAPKRGDAAAYKIEVRHLPQDSVAVSAEDVLSQIAAPPSLPAVPEPAVETPPDGPPGAGTPADGTQPEESKPSGPVIARIRRFESNGGKSTTILLDKGTKAGVATGWVGYLLNSSGKVVRSSRFKITSASSRKSKAKVPVSVDKVQQSRKVQLSPPQ